MDLFFEFEDSKCVQILFGSLEATDRVTLLFEGDVLELFHGSIRMHKLHMSDVCLREAALTTDDRESLKETFMAYLNYIGIMEIQCLNQKWNRFLESFDDKVDAISDT
ncbi:unnamed protein product [Larinioides sclopetarius]|uniref:Uncharacterized protein n=1 Tax=Larinioides sclopetarius TaxID=280406 RepID=A0AAV2AY14_9ARAC